MDWNEIKQGVTKHKHKQKTYQVSLNPVEERPRSHNKDKHYVLLLVGFVPPALLGHTWTVSQQLGSPGTQGL